jgi:hypothetical protein
VYTEKVNKVRGYVKGKLGNLWKQRNKVNRNSSKKDGAAPEVFLFQPKTKEGINHVMGTRPLKNIPFAPIFAQIRMMATKSNGFKGLDDYSRLYQ